MKMWIARRKLVLEKEPRLSGFGSRFAVGACLSACVMAAGARAHAAVPSPQPDPPPAADSVPPPASAPTDSGMGISLGPPVGHHLVLAPSHFTAGDQEYDASVNGLRAYLESVRADKPQLYAQLAPDLDRLESRAHEAGVALAAGVGLGLMSAIWGFAGRSDCALPSLSDPNFPAHADAWGTCNSDNQTHMAVFGLLGLGAVLAGGLTAWALAPSRTDLFDFVNKHNRLGDEPLKIQMGYDPAGRVAFGGAAMAF